MNHYDDNPQELLKLMRRVHEDNPSVTCEGCYRDLVDTDPDADIETAWELAVVPTSPESVRLLPPTEAVDVWDAPLDDPDHMCREFSYAHGVRCPNCDKDLSGPLALYGPRCEWPDGWKGPTTYLPTPLPELTLWAS